MIEIRLKAYGGRRTLYIDKRTATVRGRRYSLWSGDADAVETAGKGLCND